MRVNLRVLYSRSQRKRNIQGEVKLQRSQQKGIDECPWVLRYGCLCDTGE